MQNRYVGDLGDFGKYGLLRALCSSKEDDRRTLSLGVVWYLVPNEPGNDGGRIGYLDPYLTEASEQGKRYRKLDPCLYDGLRGIVQSCNRNVQRISESGFLPSDTTLFYEEPLTFEGVEDRRRGDWREQWLECAKEKTRGCDVVFVDPDNGLEVKSISRTAKKGPKYAFFNELSPYLQRDQSLVIYQHISRSGKAEDQIRKRLAEIEKELGQRAIALLYRHGTARAFLIVPAARHWETLRRRAEWSQGRWKGHFGDKVFEVTSS